MNTYNIPDELFVKYYESLMQHIENVQIAGSQLLNIDSEQLRIHDASKFEPIEFCGYAKHFHGGGDKEAFNKAWLHHIHNNPHHWNHWLIPVSGETTEMPFRYTCEMVADWIGSSVSYTKSADMSKWLNDNWSRIVLHDTTRLSLKNILLDLGYIYNEGKWSIFWADVVAINAHFCKD